MTRVNFTRAVKVEIRARATRNGVVYCENCGLPTKKFEIDHTIADALSIDRKRKLTAADGRLLCSGVPSSCHSKKTAADDAAIAKAKRREARHVGVTRPAGEIKSRGFAPSAKPKREPLRVANGLTGIARQYGVKA
jgi:hypothetical protein